MGNCTYKVDQQTPTMGGVQMLQGSVALSSSYATSGDSLNLVNYFKSTTNPVVILSSDDGYVVQSTVGRNATALLVKAYSVGWYAINANNGSANQALTEIGAGTNLSSVNVSFTAFGQPY